ncbi:hypothetical protein TNCV_984461 [Trichonephila clavipes]|nr:hypothetical protein TNCV_984461 [Trichonephila clavipes]
MNFTEINSRGKRGKLLGRIDRQNSRFRTAKTKIIKFGLHASFVESESAKNALNEDSDGLIVPSSAPVLAPDDFGVKSAACSLDSSCYKVWTPGIFFLWTGLVPLGPASLLWMVWIQFFLF